MYSAMRESVSQAGTLIKWAVSSALQGDAQDGNSNPLELLSQRYECRLVSDRAELREIFKLRYRVFRDEYRSPASIFKLDVDAFDRYGDHLTVFERQTGLPVGTYRLIPEDSKVGFYSAREFVLDPFLSTPGRKLELGRACVHPDHRNGAVLRMLWKGLLEVARSQGVDSLFGCSSVHWSSTRERGASGFALMCALQREIAGLGAWQPIDGLSPRKQYQMTPVMEEAWKASEGALLELSAPVEEPLLPPLVSSYIRSGARVVAMPAYDRDYHCLDLLTVFPVRP